MIVSQPGLKQFVLSVAFLGINHFRQVGLRFVCWFYVGNTQSSPKMAFSCFVFYGEPGIEPATPGYVQINCLILFNISVGYNCQTY